MTPYLILAMFAVFVAVAAAAASATSWLLAKGSREVRLRSLTHLPGTGLVAQDLPLSERPDATLARLSRLVPRSPKDMSRLQRRLTRAGYPHFKWTVLYALAEILLPITVAAGLLMILGLRIGLLPAILGAILAFAAPGLYVGRLTRLRQKAIQNGLPDALDLLTVCVEAGSGLDQAIAKTSEELRIAHPVLADELRLVVTETRAGKPRLEAFGNFAKRTGVEDVRALVSMLTQTDRFGTSVAQALRSHADTARTKRRQRAEERAAKVGVKLVFPLVLFLFPALYVVCFGPVVVQVYRAFFTQ